jgi:arylsulfatase A-like enzyme
MYQKVVLVSVMALTGICLSSAFAARVLNKPNILFIMSDDHTTQAVGAYGSRLARLNPSPTIDALAREGMLFENAICTNSICTPSRACIMTGQYSHVNGCITLNERLEHDRQYLALEMARAGYQTAIVGKWHLKERPSAFDYYKVLPGQGKYFDPVFFETDKAGQVQMKGHSTDCITDSALDWFCNKRSADRPFFLKLHFKAPHDFFEFAPRYQAYLEDVEIPEPASLYHNRKHGSLATRGQQDSLLPYIGTSIGPRNLRRNYTKLKRWGCPPELSEDEAKSFCYQEYLKWYLRCVKGVDDNLKRVFDYMKAEGIFDNTVIIYTGDQGMWLGEHDYQDKRWGYEESLKMPFIVRYPKTIKAGARTDALVENVDYPVTMLDFAGVKRPDYMQGHSFRQILETAQEPRAWRKEAYYQYWMHMAHHDNPGHFALRSKQYKLIFFYGRRANAKGGRAAMVTPPGWELYDLHKDPEELNNVYDHPGYAQTVTGLKQRLKALRQRIGVDDPQRALNDYVRREIEVVNEVVERFWDYDEADRQKAIAISKQFLQQVSE